MLNDIDFVNLRFSLLVIIALPECHTQDKAPQGGYFHAELSTRMGISNWSG